jgi:hypothetical protein
MSIAAENLPLPRRGGGGAAASPWTSLLSLYSLPPSEIGFSQLSVTVLFVISFASGCPGAPGGSI